MAVERSLDLYLRALEPTEKQDRLLSLTEAAKITPYTQEYLTLLARKRRIAAVKVSRTWMITERELRRYLKEVERSRGLLLKKARSTTGLVGTGRRSQREIFEALDKMRE